MDYGIIIMEAKIDFRQIETIEALKEEIQNSWDQISQEMIDKTIDSFRKRVRKVVSIGGGSIQRYKL